MLRGFRWRALVRFTGCIYFNKTQPLKDAFLEFPVAAPRMDSSAVFSVLRVPKLGSIDRTGANRAHSNREYVLPL